MAEKKGKKMMWDGRFDCGMAQSMIDLSFSLDFDKELLEEDIQKQPWNYLWTHKRWKIC